MKNKVRGKSLNPQVMESGLGKTQQSRTVCQVNTCNRNPRGTIPPGFHATTMITARLGTRVTSRIWNKCRPHTWYSTSQRSPRILATFAEPALQWVPNYGSCVRPLSNWMTQEFGVLDSIIGPIWNEEKRSIGTIWYRNSTHVECFFCRVLPSAPLTVFQGHGTRLLVA